MPIAALTFNQPVNSSLQVGDLVYYIPTSTLPNSTVQQAVTANVTLLGVVQSIVSTPVPTVNVIYDAAAVSPPTGGEYIMFEKDKRVNSSSVIGYYADVELINSSSGKIELFSLAAGVSESSK
tara:strand:+ start:54 stop:422 length:369 start_codon:yes stop_codon:yes gene_type:complete